MNWIITLKKGVLGLLTGLAGVIVMKIVEAITNYNPTVCTAEVTTNCTSQVVASAYFAIIPVVSAFLVGIANWLKNRSK